jgi:hypothetical protein
MMSAVSDPVPRRNAGRIDHIILIYRTRESQEQARKNFTELLGVDDWDELGEASEGLYIFISWRSGLELVCPTRAVGTFERHLTNHGEGFYCLVFGVASLDQAIANIARLNGRTPRELPDPPSAVLKRFSVAREAFVGEVSGLRLMLGEFVPRADAQEAEK